MMRPVTFASDGLRLVGILGEGRGASRRGVVLIPGWTGYRTGPHRILVHAARRLNEAGYATLHFDLRGRGDSEGDYNDTDLDMMVADALRAAAVLRAEVPCDDLSLLGICSGANVALGAATLDPSIGRVAAWSALPFQRQVTRKQAAARRRSHALAYLKKLFRLDTWRKALAGRVHYDLVGKALKGTDAVQRGERNLKDSSRDILSELARYPGRILFVHGSKDPEGMVAREHFTAFCESHGVRARFHLVEGANHSYYSLAWEREILDRTLAFLQEE